MSAKRIHLLAGLLVAALHSFTMAQTVTTKDIAFNGMTFHCRVAGDAANEPVILLHGWPETSHMWIPLMERLANEGYYCIAPDQRGFSPKARPQEIAAYDIRELAQDVIRLADTLGIGNFHLVGHDWGSAIGWAVVTFHAPRIKSWTAMSVPHVRAFGDAIRSDAKQRKMSRYMAWFQWRGLPEWFLLRSNAKALKDVWRKSSPEEVQDYLTVLGNKDGLRASLNYYRANYGILKKGEGAEAFGDIATPTLFLWGKKDFAIGRTGVEGTAKFMKGSYKLVEVDATHWLVQEALEQCHAEISTHLARYR